jgi:murein DD-endopeptidase MepM/ murein hydrolase activator NlpD
MKLPYKGAVRITTPFGKKGSWQCGWHIGIDLVGTDKRIYPITDGVVIRAGDGGSYGNHVRIKHSNGYISLYAHLRHINVKVGQSVTGSTQIGTEGSTGNSSGYHLHLEIHKGGYRYPSKTSIPKTCPWIVNPAEVLKIANKVGPVVGTVSEGDEVEKIIKIKLNGKVKEVTAIEKDGNNYIKLQDLRDGKIEIGYDSTAKLPIINAK